MELHRLERGACSYLQVMNNDLAIIISASQQITMYLLREGLKKKLGKSGQADRFGGEGGHPPSA